MILCDLYDFPTRFALIHYFTTIVNYMQIEIFEINVFLIYRMDEFSKITKFSLSESLASDGNNCIILNQSQL